MKETTYYKLKKPQDNDNVLISDLNGNADAVDAALHALAEGLNGAQGSLASAPEKQRLVDGDGVVVTDSAAGNSAKRVLWSTMKTVLGQLFAPLTHKHAAGDVTSGTFAAARIPGLDAGKITSGILPVARGGTGVSSLDELVKALGAVKVTAGSYTGNGQYGKETPNSLSFPFPPKFLMIAEPQGYSVIVINNSQYALYSGVGAWYLFATWSGNSVSWYSPDGERDQMNSSGKTYTYYAFG